MENQQSIAFIGYGEAARAFAAGWAESPLRRAAYDIKTEGPGKAAQQALYAADATQGFDRLEEAIAAGRIVLSLVTADQALVAAQAAAQSPLEGRLYCDGNSCAPETKKAARDAIEAAGGRYVDLAVMAPVHPKLHRTPTLVSGPHAEEAQSVLSALDMDVALAEGPVGAASSIKLCRSIIVKGLEALTAEMLLTARHLGVEGPVLASLEDTYPGYDWPRRSSYAFDRMMIHGARRAAEMEETAKMVAATGLPEGMASATARWEADIAALGEAPGADDALDRADRVLAKLLSKAQTAS